jgi:8-oxo-dGTP pyrophosphatase MutT (NUDIX family)
VTFPGSDGDVVILTRRPATLRRHPGQIAFPGGMIEPTDPTPLAAALREAREEIGLDLTEVHDAVALPSVGTLSSDIVIQPYWIRLLDVPDLQPDPNEVDEILLVPLAKIRRPECLGSIPHPRRLAEQVPAIVWRDQVIWGATLRTLFDLFGQLDT